MTCMYIYIYMFVLCNLKNVFSKDPVCRTSILYLIVFRYVEIHTHAFESLISGI